MLMIKMFIVYNVIASVTYHPGGGTDRRVDQRSEMLKEFSPKCGEVNRLWSFIAR